MKFVVRLLAAALVAAALVAAAPAALAADAFTVNVPVDFKSLNAAVNFVRIRCTLTARDPGTLAMTDFGPPKWTDLPVTGGATPTAPVVLVWRVEDFTPAQQANFGNVTGGGCQFQLSASGSLYIPYGGETGPLLAQRPGAPFRSRVTFTFP
jgi:hypothetical protein